MLADGEVRYVPPEQCITREEELQGAKPTKMLQLDSLLTGLCLKDAEESPLTTSVVCNLSLFQALTRRDLAADLVGVATYSTMHKWTEYLMRVLSDQPAAGFLKASQAQVLRADRQAWAEANRQCSEGLHPRADGKRPLDVVFEQMQGCTKVIYYLLNVPAGNAQRALRQDDGGAEAVESKKRKRQTKKEKKEAARAAAAKKQATGEKEEKHQKVKRDPAPKACSGLHTRTPEGDPICYGFNLDGCKEAGCKKKHVCARPGCYQAHSQRNHPE
jgi:hypothetical protein